MTRSACRSTGAFVSIARWTARRMPATAVSAPTRTRPDRHDSPAVQGAARRLSLPGPTCRGAASPVRTASSARRGALDHDAVGRKTLARPHLGDLADREVFSGHRRGAVRSDQPRHGGLEGHQVADRARAAPPGGVLDQPAGEQERDDHRRRVEEDRAAARQAVQADAERRRRAERDERVHRGTARAQRPDRARQERPPAVQHDRRGEHRRTAAGARSAPPAPMPWNSPA